MVKSKFLDAAAVIYIVLLWTAIAVTYYGAFIAEDLLLVKIGLISQLVILSATYLVKKVYYR